MHAIVASLALLCGRGVDGVFGEPPAEPGAKQESAEDAALRRAVDKAIEQGVAWLLKAQNASGRWAVQHEREHTALSEQAFVMFVLAKCGVTEKHPVMKRGLDGLPSLLGGVPLQSGGGWAYMSTYAHTMVLLLHEALYAQAPKEEPRSSKRYAGRPGARNPCKLPPEVRERIQAIVDWLVLTQTATAWRYPGPAHEPDKFEDTSCTQLVLLALQAAARCGIEVSPEVYKKALTYLLSAQEEEGVEVDLMVENPAWSPGPENRYPRFIKSGRARARGFRYYRDVPPTSSMTAAGVAALAIVKDRLRALEALDEPTTRTIDRALRDGLTWLGAKFDVTRNLGSDHWHYYFLYGLERVGSLLGVRYLGEHDWYREGAEHLIAAQRADGSWPSLPAGATQPWSHHDAVVQTCFALLFLKRATPAPFRPLGPVVTQDR